MEYFDIDKSNVGASKGIHSLTWLILAVEVPFLLGIG